MRLAIERKSRGWSQEFLADQAGLHQQLISGIERGRIRPRPDELARLAAVLDVHPPELLLDPVIVGFVRDGVQVAR